MSYKKIVAITFAAFSLLVVAFFIMPLQSSIRETIQFSANSNALFRQLMRDTVWHRWWPGKIEFKSKEREFICNQTSFASPKFYLNSISFRTSFNSITTNSILSISAPKNDSVVVVLDCKIPLSTNPVTRIKMLFASSHIRATYKEFLNELSAYFSVRKNLYDLDIRETTVGYEYVVSTTRIFSHYPTNPEVYSMISDLKVFLSKNSGKELGAPMMHVEKTGNQTFHTQVAIPTDQKFNETNEIKSKWLLKGGHILVAKVTGGRTSVADASKQLSYYILDNRKSPVAISFEYLITNRLEEPDSSKWITELYFPVI
jgi:effector-binding domain-containing protein